MTYRILVTGSRSWRARGIIEDALAETTADITDDKVIVHGSCPTGADLIAARWADRYAFFGITPEGHTADWDHCAPDCPPRHRRRKKPGDIHHPGQLADYCPAAGPRRNQAMVAAGADVCLAFLTPGSRGTLGTIRFAEAAGIEVRVWGQP